MQITETQIAQVNKQIKALLSAESFYGKKLEEAGVTSIQSAEDFQKKQQQAQQELNIFGASMQRQFMSDLESRLGDIAKDKNVGIIVMKEAVPSGGIDVTDDLIAKMQ